MVFDIGTVEKPILNARPDHPVAGQRAGGIGGIESGNQIGQGNTPAFQRANCILQFAKLTDQLTKACPIYLGRLGKADGGSRIGSLFGIDQKSRIMEATVEEFLNHLIAGADKAGLLALDDLVKGRTGDINVAHLNQYAHLSIEKG